MAFSLVRFPALRFGLDDQIFKLSTTTPSTTTNIVQGVIQVQRDGNNIGSEYVYPYSPIEWNFLFPQIIAQSLATTIPDPAQNAITIDNTISDRFAFQYWERTIDTVNQTTTDGIVQTAGNYTILNSRCPYTDNYDYSGDYIVLSDRPKKNIIGHNQADYLYIYVNVNTRIRWTGYRKDGTTANFISAPLTDNEVNIVPIGTGANNFWGGVIDDTDLSYYTLEFSVNNGAFSNLYRFDVISDCGLRDCIELVFQECKGGYASMRFNEAKAVSVTRTSDVFTCEPDIVTTPEQRRLELGRQSKNAQTVKAFALTKKLKYEQGYEYLLQSLFTSNNVFIKRLINGTYQLTRVTLANSRYKVTEDNKILFVSIQATLSQRKRSSH